MISVGLIKMTWELGGDKKITTGVKGNNILQVKIIWLRSNSDGYLWKWLLYEQIKAQTSLFMRHSQITYQTEQLL